MIAEPNLFAAADLKQDRHDGGLDMTEDAQHDTTERKPLIEAALEEMLKFERKEIEFRKKDRAERAADLQLPLDEIKVQ
jgi:hypothetical protein